jgi:hypothetical protein
MTIAEARYTNYVSVTYFIFFTYLLFPEKKSIVGSVHCTTQVATGAQSAEIHHQISRQKRNSSAGDRKLNNNETDVQISDSFIVAVQQPSQQHVEQLHKSILRPRTKKKKKKKKKTVFSCVVRTTFGGKLSSGSLFRLQFFNFLLSFSLP